MVYLDNVALTNNPRVEIVDGAVNVDDLLNNEIGGMIRVKQAGAVNAQAVPFVAGQTLSALQYFDQQVEDKTGVTKASTGLSPDSLQSTTATAVQATVQAQAAQVEVMARNLAEGGMRQMFKLMLKTMVENVDEEQMMRLQGQSYTPVDPRSWNLGMDVSINVGLGTGREDQKIAVLNQTLQMQIQIFQTYGPGNGMVSLTNIRNTLSDILAINGVRNSDSYFAPMDPMIEQQMMMQQQMQAQQGQQNDPNAAFLQAEQIKAQAKMQTNEDQLKLDQLEAYSGRADRYGKTTEARRAGSRPTYFCGRDHRQVRHSGRCRRIKQLQNDLAQHSQHRQRSVARFEHKGSGGTR